MLNIVCRALRVYLGVEFDQVRIGMPRDGSDQCMEDTESAPIGRYRNAVAEGDGKRPPGDGKGVLSKRLALLQATV